VANVRVESAPRTKAIPAKTGRVGLRSSGLASRTASAAFGSLSRGGRVVTLSKGSVSFADAVLYCLALSGPAAVTVSTWTIGAREIGAFRDLVSDGRITSLQVLIDATFPARHPAYAAKLRASFGADCLRLANCHAKIATVINAHWALVVLSSANLNQNRRLEFFNVEDNRALATAITDTLGEWFAESLDWDATPAVHRAAFDAWHPEDTPAPVVPAPVTPTPSARALVPADGDTAFFSNDPYGTDLRRTGLSFVR
jgi:hypothetical protein